MSECPDLCRQAVLNRVFISAFNRTVGAIVNVTCAEEGHSLAGLSQMTCQNNGNWSGDLPVCSGDAGGLSERETIIIAVSCSVVFLVLVVLLIIAACYIRSKEKNKRKRSERLAATLEKLSIRDPLDELVRRESRRSSYGNPVFTSSSFGENDIDRRPDGRSGTTLVRTPMSTTWHYPGGSRLTRSLKLYKIWDHTRTRKQFVFADGLDELVQKGGQKLNVSGPIRVVLEEDGTEIDNDSVLRACAGMVFLLLEQNQMWAKPELVLSVHEYSNNLNHYRYDVDEKL